MQIHASFVLFVVFLTISVPFFVYCQGNLRPIPKEDETIADYENEKDLPAKPSEVNAKDFDPFAVKLFKVKWCRPDILRFCPKSSYEDNYAILQCLQKDQPTVKSVAKECKTFLLAYKMKLTTSNKFKAATETMCGTALIEQTGCNSVGTGPGDLLSCMLDKLDEISSNTTCSSFLKKIRVAVIDDYWIVKHFLEACDPLIKEYNCGVPDPIESGGSEEARAKGQQEAPDSGSQAGTLGCLTSSLKKAGKKPPNACRRQMLHLAELQADDIHSDRHLLWACHEDVEKYCSSIRAGNGRVYRCLIENRQKTSNGCKERLATLVENIEQDVKVFRAFYSACRRELQTADCRRALRLPQAEGEGAGAPDDKTEFVRLSAAVVCLNEAVEERPRAVGRECTSMLRSVRKMLFDDYKLSVNLVHACNAEIISEDCKQDEQPAESGAGDGRFRLDDKAANRQSAQVVHCLMKLVKRASEQKKDAKPVSADCKKELRVYLREVNPTADVHLDPYMSEVCAPVIEAACVEGGDGSQDTASDMDSAERQGDGRGAKNAAEARSQAARKEEERAHIQGDSEWAFRCLLEQLDADVMQEHPQCSERVREVAYFVTRDFRLDPHLYSICNADANLHCQAHLAKWKFANFTQDDLENGDFVLPCLYGHVKAGEVKGACADEVRRVMRQRALSVDLVPEIENVCLKELGDLCSDNTDKGHEIDCLRKKVQEIEKGKCRDAVVKHIRDMQEDLLLDRLLYRQCRLLIRTHCASFARQSENANEERLLECLVEHKMDATSSRECRVVIEHHQLIGFEDVEFSPAFTRACKQDMDDFCSELTEKNQKPDKAELLECLAEAITENGLGRDLFPDLGKPSATDQLREVSAQCRAQIHREFLQQRADPKLDPLVNKACEADIKKFGCTGETELQTVKPHAVGQVMDSRQAKNVDRLECLKQNFVNLSVECRERVFRRAMVDAQDNSVDVVLQDRCRAMITKFCVKATPSKVLECLQSNTNDPEFEAPCARVLQTRALMQSLDFRLQPELMKACSSDIVQLCSAVISSHNAQFQAIKFFLNAFSNRQVSLLNTVQMFEGKVIGCLRENYVNDTLKEECEDQLRVMMRGAAFRFNLDSQLKRSCGRTINNYCTKPLENPAFLQALSASGDRRLYSERVLHDESLALLRAVQAVEICLKDTYQKKNVEEPGCRSLIERLVKEETADIHVDTLLFSACRNDLRVFCAVIPEGKGLKARCLLGQLDAEDRAGVKPVTVTQPPKSSKKQTRAPGMPPIKALLSEKCRTLLEERRIMWARLMPQGNAPESLVQLAHEVAGSPARMYLLVVLLSIAALICCCGCICGRTSRRYIKLSSKVA